MHRTRAFTLLEVALIVAIIGMMLMMIIGYLLAPKEKGPLPPVAESPPILSSPTPAMPVLRASVPSTPAPAPAPVPATPAPNATPAQTIDLSPQSSPLFR